MKILADTRTRQYELTYLLPVSYTDAELTKLADAIQTLVTKAGATEVTVEAWGRKRLAYKIKKAHTSHTEAQYYHLMFLAEPAKISALERQMFIHPQVLRHLLVVVDARAAKQAAERATRLVASQAAAEAEAATQDHSSAQGHSGAKEVSDQTRTTRDRKRPN